MPRLTARLRRAAIGAGADTDVPGRLAQLTMQILPFPHPQVMQEFATAHAAERRAGQLALPLVQVIPQREEGEEVGPGLGETRMHRVRGLTGVCGPFSRVLDGQCRRDDQYLANASLM